MIKISDDNYTKRGRPINNEFEEEVCIECEKSLEPDDKKLKRKKANEFSYAHVKQCALIVREKDYLDDKSNTNIKKWKENETTNRLKFTNKWVYGVLRRRAERNLTLDSKQSEDMSTVKVTDDNQCSSNIVATNNIIRSINNDNSSVSTMMIDDNCSVSLLTGEALGKMSNPHDEPPYDMLNKDDNAKNNLNVGTSSSFPYDDIDNVFEILFKLEAQYDT
jgi:hypothetical protein